MVLVAYASQPDTHSFTVRFVEHEQENHQGSDAAGETESLTGTGSWESSDTIYTNHERRAKVYLTASL
jgi:hypothetical protein